MEPKKKCTKCKHTKPLSEFHRDCNKTDGRKARCKMCARAANQIKMRIIDSDPVLKAAQRAARKVWEDRAKRRKEIESNMSRLMKIKPDPNKTLTPISEEARLEMLGITKLDQEDARMEDISEPAEFSNIQSLKRIRTLGKIRATKLELENLQKLRVEDLEFACSRDTNRRINAITIRMDCLNRELNGTKRILKRRHNNKHNP